MIWTYFLKLFSTQSNPEDIHLSDLDIADLNPNRQALIKLCSYLRCANLDGDYCEFGVYQGKTFALAVQAFHYFFPKMIFRAFDSFEGLPPFGKKDVINKFDSNFYEGMFKCSKTDFISYLKRKNIALDSVSVTKGWFKTSLPKIKEPYKIAVAWVDCDIYSSTVDVLKFITPRLIQGSVLIFDDWYAFRNIPSHGQQLACKEWLKKNRHIKLNPYFSYGWHGQVFTVSV